MGTGAHGDEAGTLGTAIEDRGLGILGVHKGWVSLGNEC